MSTTTKLAQKSEMGAAIEDDEPSVIGPDTQPIDVMAFPHRRGYKPLTTIPNVQFMFDRYGIKLRYNVIKKRIDFTIPGLDASIDNRANVSLTQLQSLAELNNLKTDPMGAYTEAIADQNQYNPVLEWIESQPWDGFDRFKELCDTLTVKDSYPIALKEALVYRWILGATAAAYKPGFHTRGVLTLQGGQGLGKTSWITALVPPRELRESVIKLGHHLDAGNKDSLLLAVCHWIVEMGELDSSFKKDIARLKGFITDSYDKIRRPYAKSESDYQRRMVMCASVNEDLFLVDPTGNTRFWTVPVTHINYQHGIDMQQVFAQAKHLVDQGEEWHLNPQEDAMLDAENKKHQAISAVREMVLDAILHPDDPRATQAQKLSASEVLRRVLQIKSPNNNQAREAGHALREFYGEPVGRTGGNAKWMVYVAEPDLDGLYPVDEPAGGDSQGDFEDVPF